MIRFLNIVLADPSVSGDAERNLLASAMALARKKGGEVLEIATYDQLFDESGGPYDVLVEEKCKAYG